MSKSSTKPSPDAAPKPTTMESIRETVDSIVIAFVLAFLFRTFEAEAFVIPTGSMALTLMGDHKDLTCAQCGYSYRCGASVEVPNTPQEQAEYDRRPDAWKQAHTVTSSVCPNCRYRMHYDELEPGKSEHPPDVPLPPSYKGDRILVTKYSYDFADPERWDVAVFKNPSQAKINYIKRVAALPNEDVLLYRGDVYTRPRGSEQPYRIARKPPDKAAAMAQTVYDHDYVQPRMHERGWPQRWVSKPDAATAAWKQSADLRSFELDGGDELTWLRYQHYVPLSTDWETMKKTSLDPAQRAQIKPQLITDFCENNTERIRSGIMDADIAYLGLHWVGDVAIDCELTLGERRSDDAEAVLEIVEGGVAYQCRIQVASGDATLSIAGLDGFRPTARGAVRGSGPHRLRLANVDDQLLLWIDGKPIEFDASTHFQTVETLRAVYGQKEVDVAFDGDSRFPALNNLIPKSQDVGSPLGVGVKGCRASLAHLRVLRDVYYVADSDTTRGGNWNTGEKLEPVRDYREDVFTRFAQERARRNLGPAVGLRAPWNERSLADFMSDVDVMPERFSDSSFVHFLMHDDQYFVLGDNSPRSLDSRLWRPDETFVRRELLIGKALFVYWPHALDEIPGTGIPFPFFPNFGRMRMIR